MAASTLLVCLANVKTIKYAPLPTHFPVGSGAVSIHFSPSTPFPTPPPYFAEEDSETTLDFCLPPTNYRIQNILLSPHRRNLPRCLQWRSYCPRLAKNLTFNRFLCRICNWNRRGIHSPTNQPLGAAKSASGGTVYKRKNMEYNCFNPASSGK